MKTLPEIYTALQQYYEANDDNGDFVFVAINALQCAISEANKPVAYDAVDDYAEGNRLTASHLGVGRFQ